MFSTKEHLEKRTGPNGVGRLPYLQSLVSEFQETVNEEAKLQICANLANFAYDPINYEYLKALNAVDLFLDSLTENNEKLVKYALSGVCNIILDNDIRNDILKGEGLMLIAECLNRSDEEILLTALTIIYYLLPLPSTLNSQVWNNLSTRMRSLSVSTNLRICNLVQLIMGRM